MSTNEETESRRIKPFSEREGHVSPRTALQIEAVDKTLRNRLWTVLLIFIFQRPDQEPHFIPGFMRGATIWNQHFELYWDRVLKESIDMVPTSYDTALRRVRDGVLSGVWFLVYDILEFFLDINVDDQFRNALNTVLEQEAAGCRIVDGKVVRITDKHELASIERAMQVSPETGASKHLGAALKLLSAREGKADYRNSIKESISAVESIARQICGKHKATLADALKAITKKGEAHPALANAFNVLYGYTSDEEGIRHAMSDDSTVGFAEAKYMLVACAGFVNYLKTKASEQGTAQ